MLNLGLRYEYEAPMTVKDNIYSRLDPATGRLLAAGLNASETLDIEADKLNFAPRIGLAYTLDPRRGLDGVALRSTKNGSCRFWTAVSGWPSLRRNG
jgi:hypothetical protein